MDIRCFNNMNFSECIENLALLPDGAVAILGEGILPSVDLERELNGDSGIIKQLSILTAGLNISLFAFLHAELNEKHFHTVIVVSRGKIFGMSDMTHKINSTVSTGVNYRIYEIDKKYIGVIVGDDIYFPEVSRVLSLADSDFLVSLTDEISNIKLINMLKAQSLTNGIMIICVTSSGSIITDSDGKYALVNNSKYVKINASNQKNNYYIAAYRDVTLNDVVIENGKD